MKDRVYQVGEKMPRPDGVSKGRGSERFAADGYPAGLLWAGVKRAGVAHALIRGIDCGPALQVAGVVDVLTAADVGGSNRQGVIRRDQPVLVDDRIRHCGDAVALVIARDKPALQQALDLIELDLELLPAVFDPEEALKEDAPIIHDDHPQGNALFHGVVSSGEGEKAFAGCEEIVEGCFELPRQAHVFLETENGFAIADDKGMVEITVSTQTPFRDRFEVAEALGIEMGRIRILAPFCGGGFGGKDGITVQSFLALAALRCPGRPVKMYWSREESMAAGAKRHPARLYYRLGSDRDGRLTALSARIYFDTGPYDHLGGAVAALGLEHAGGPYRIPNTRIEAWAVYTNNPLSGAFRGFGVPQVAAAIESMIDVLAERLNLSPLAIRQKNALARGEKCPAGVLRDSSTGLHECLRILESHELWRQRTSWKKAAGLFKRRGTGIACVWHGMGYGPLVPDSATAGIEMSAEGTFRVLAGIVDMGQGNGSTYLQIAGDILCQNSAIMELILPDTEKTFPSGSSSASRTTYAFGNALIGAAKRLKKQLLARSADLLMAKEASEMALIPGAVLHLPSGREFPLKKLAAILHPSERSAVSHFRAKGSKQMEQVDKNLRLHGFPHTTFSFAVHLARVEVDVLTGQVELLDYLNINDCGRIINPALFEGQQEGGIAQGLGYVLFEDVRATDGRVQTADLTTYIIPTAADVPRITTVAVPLEEHTGPYGMKGAGEIGIDGPAPAVANAVADACGCRLYHFPMTAERILRSITAGSAE